MSFNLNPVNEFPNLYDSINSKFRDYNPMVFITLLAVFIFYYFIFSSASSSSSVMSSVSSASASASSSSSSLKILELLFWGLLVFLVLINGLKLFLSVDITAAIRNIFSSEPIIDITVDDKNKDNSVVPEIKFEKQVFHIPENDYTYQDANALCKAYDARLASYDEVEESYKDGGEWCSYGWSKDQLALFPTQKKTYDKLQKIKGHENDCGRPGINGGFIDNKDARFGVNCYGYKPEITGEERELMREIPHYPITEKDKRMQKKIDKYRMNLPNILISPFNNSRWSVI